MFLSTITTHVAYAVNRKLERISDELTLLEKKTSRKSVYGVKIVKPSGKSLEPFLLLLPTRIL
jgi:hypothetical protein